MTPKQKQQKIQVIENIIQVAGFTQDRYGNWKTTLDIREYRIKIKKINIRIETKIGTTWKKVLSSPIVHFDVVKFSIWIAPFIKQNQPKEQP